MLNQCNFIGNLTEDANLAYLESGTAVLNYTVAVNSTWKDSDGNKQERVLFLRCAAWGKLGEALHDYMLKGTKIYCSGELETKRVGDDENAKWYTSLRVQTIRLLSSKRQDDQQEQQEEQPRRQQRRQNGNGNGQRTQQRRQQQQPRRQRHEPPPDDGFGDDDIPF